jgi:hypothetical protein
MFDALHNEGARNYGRWSRLDAAVDQLARLGVQRQMAMTRPSRKCAKLGAI